MTSVRLVACNDEYDNSLGLRIRGIPETDGFMAAREGLLIAHDLIEHCNGLSHIGKVWDELEAMGGIWHVRGRHGDMMTRNIHSPQVNVASDITRMFPQWISECGPRAPRTRSCDYEADFDDILTEVAKDIPKEHDHDDLHRLGDYLFEARARMRLGMRKMERRFRYSRFDSNSQFRAIMEAADRAIKWIEFEGQEFILSYGSGEANVREAYSREAY